MLVSEPIATKREIALRTGADMAVDPLTEDLAAAAAKLTCGRGFDALIEASGNLQAANRAPSWSTKVAPWSGGGVYPYNAEIPMKRFPIYLKGADHPLDHGRALLLPACAPVPAAAQHRIAGNERISVG